MAKDLIHEVLGYTSADPVALAELKPLEIVREVKQEKSLEQVMDELVEMSIFGDKADALWDAIKDATKYKLLKLPENTDLVAIKQELKASIERSATFNERKLIQELDTAETIVNDADYI